MCRVLPDKHRQPLILRPIFSTLLISSVVFGIVDEELFQAFGWAQAQSRGAEARIAYQRSAKPFYV